MIIDGVCPYHGPAIVLETAWDATGILSLQTGRPLAGDTTGRNFDVHQEGVKTSIYGEERTYLYGASLFLYNARRRTLLQLLNEEAAQEALARQDRWLDPCPADFLGHGVPI